MRAIDADALQLAIVEEGQANKRKKYIIGDIWELTGAEIREVINSQPTIHPEPHWIPVTERLPEESGLYQVTDMQGNVVRYVFNANDSSVEYWRRCVKAWMPLPEPYKGVTE